jgi:hypothetical protein
MAKGKTQGMQRIHLKIPDHIYSEIEKIAIAVSQPAKTDNCSSRFLLPLRGA